MADELAVVLGDQVPDVVVPEQPHRRSASAEADGGVQPVGANAR